MKGKCIGGPLDGQEREADGMYLRTTTFLADDRALLPIQAIAGVLEHHVYEIAAWCDNLGTLHNVWKYVGTQ